MEGKSVAVVGGGPSGSFAAYLLARGGARVEIFEPRHPRRPELAEGERKMMCTGCAGLVQSNALGVLEKYGITIPPSVVESRLRGATIYFPKRSLPLKVSSYNDAITVYRGFGPVHTDDQSVDSFDAFLLNLATKAGAIHREVAIDAVDLREDEEGRVRLRDPGGAFYTANIVIGAFGHNPPLMGSITYPTPNTPRLTSPRTQKATVREYYFGEERVAAMLDHNIHVFGNPLPTVWFAALLPKGAYVTAVIMGRDADVKAGDFTEFFRKPEVRRLLGADFDERTSCACFSSITLKSPHTYMVCGRHGRVVMVNIGDAGPTRPRKNGIFAALDSAERLAQSLLEHGNDSHGLVEYKKYIDRTYVRDNLWSELVLKVSDVLLEQSLSQRVIAYLAAANIPLVSLGVRSAIDQVLTGRGPYWRVPLNIIRDAIRW